MDNQESSADQRTSQVGSLEVCGIFADACPAHSDLRERLLGGIQGSGGQTTQRMDHHQSHHPIHGHDHNIDPAIAGSGMLNAHVGDSGVDGNQSDGKRGKRELSTSKRAAQNRAAQVGTSSSTLVIFYLRRRASFEYS